MTSPTAGAFHTHDGLFFRRSADGGVDVVFPVREPGNTGYPDRYDTITLDADTWASVVASVSAGGEQAGSWRAALEFHNGEANEVTRRDIAYEHRGEVVEGSGVPVTPWAPTTSQTFGSPVTVTDEPGSVAP